ncbi:4'-phosphopantetheinyl transferase family protein [Bacteroides zoogleoformans]|uniref:4'-phosphopantetheinyl transferase family protein n=1 Tax=Bacteroides zoogleoformans TaxID=28119 RepID=UPI00248E1C01|nr:4'-phosphopantetheinyl transferase superfamily protein [Bacteroides zoogleoformans]
MPLFLKDRTSSCQWGVWKTDETPEDLLTMLPQEKKYREVVQSFRSEHRRVEWMAVRVLLYTLLGEEKEIAYYSGGKPYLADASASLSISHTKGYVAVALGPWGKDVGVDVEQYAERVRKVAHRYMREDEETSVFQGTDTWSLLLHWSAKETIFKCLNTSEVDFRNHLRIMPFTIAKEGTFSAEEYRTPEKRCFTIRYFIFADFVLTLSL